MTSTGKGCVVAAVIGALAVFYAVFFVAEPQIEMSPYNDDRVLNYLNNPPEIETDVIAARGSPAIDFTYATTDNHVISLSDYIGRKYVIIDFWATWCGPCQMELPELQEFYEQRGDEIQIIAVTSEDASSSLTVIECVQDKGLTFPVLHDPSGKISSVYPHEGIPFLVLIDKDGTLRATYVGYTSATDELVHTVFGI